MKPGRLNQLTVGLNTGEQFLGLLVGVTPDDGIILALSPEHQKLRRFESADVDLMRVEAEVMVGRQFAVEDPDNLFGIRRP